MANTVTYLAVLEELHAIEHAASFTERRLDDRLYHHIGLHAEMHIDDWQKTFLDQLKEDNMHYRHNALEKLRNDATVARSTNIIAVMEKAFDDVASMTSRIRCQMDEVITPSLEILALPEDAFERIIYPLTTPVDDKLLNDELSELDHVLKQIDALRTNRRVCRQSIHSTISCIYSAVQSDVEQQKMLTSGGNVDKMRLLLEQIVYQGSIQTGLVASLVTLRKRTEQRPSVLEYEGGQAEVSDLTIAMNVHHKVVDLLLELHEAQSEWTEVLDRLREEIASQTRISNHCVATPMFTQSETKRYIQSNRTASIAEHARRVVVPNARLERVALDIEPAEPFCALQHSSVIESNASSPGTAAFEFAITRLFCT
ncbi:hypothetical protein C8Q76DRAFT_797577 [Earliella scabrosa]|nr:hypothetical protein C8Q76DRAFT_797577 [Earliella scabrosa]